jgi:NADPH:quinone reductase-like Zn-dependent oxidoreductase
MLAAVGRRYGPPDMVTAADVPRPEPRDDEILVRVRAAAVGVVDGLARRGSPWYARAHFGVLRPRFPVLGCDFAGQVEAAGPAVSACYPLARIADAYRHVDAGHKKGTIVITVS